MVTSFVLLLLWGEKGEEREEIMVVRAYLIIQPTIAHAALFLAGSRPYCTNTCLVYHSVDKAGRGCPYSTPCQSCNNTLQAWCFLPFVVDGKGGDCILSDHGAGKDIP